MATPTQQYVQLLTKRYHLCLKRLSRPEEVDDHSLEQIQELEHPEFMARFGPSRQADGICDRDRTLKEPRAARDSARGGPFTEERNAYHVGANRGRRPLFVLLLSRRIGRSACVCTGAAPPSAAQTICSICSAHLTWSKPRGLTSSR